MPNCFPGPAQSYAVPVNPQIGLTLPDGKQKSNTHYYGRMGPG